jgi:hypothetical protein
METIVATSFKEVQRSRIAIFGANARTLELAGSVVTGTVYSVCEVESSDPPAWRIKLRQVRSTEYRTIASGD